MLTYLFCCFLFLTVVLNMTYVVTQKRSGVFFVFVFFLFFTNTVWDKYDLYYSLAVGRVTLNGIDPLTAIMLDWKYGHYPVLGTQSIRNENNLLTCRVVWEGQFSVCWFSQLLFFLIHFVITNIVLLLLSQCYNLLTIVAFSPPLQFSVL